MIEDVVEEMLDSDSLKKSLMFWINEDIDDQEFLLRIWLLEKTIKNELEQKHKEECGAV